MSFVQNINVNAAASMDRGIAGVDNLRNSLPVHTRLYQGHTLARFWSNAAGRLAGAARPGGERPITTQLVVTEPETTPVIGAANQAASFTGPNCQGFQVRLLMAGSKPAARMARLRWSEKRSGDSLLSQAATATSHQAMPHCSALTG